MVSWNPVHFHFDRQHDISYELKAQDIVGAIGTKIKSHGTQNEYITELPHHFAVHWGWRKGPGISNSCGVSVMLKKSAVQQDAYQTQCFCT